MLECENGCLPLSHVLNSKVLLYTKLNVNFNTTKVTKSFEPQKYLKGSLLFSHTAKLITVHQMDWGQAKESLVIFLSMNCYLHLAFLDYANSTIRSFKSNTKEKASSSVFLPKTALSQNITQ